MKFLRQKFDIQEELFRKRFVQEMMGTSSKGVNDAKESWWNKLKYGFNSVSVALFGEKNKPIEQRQQISAEGASGLSEQVQETGWGTKMLNWANSALDGKLEELTKFIPVNTSQLNFVMNYVDGFVIPDEIKGIIEELIECEYNPQERQADCLNRLRGVLPGRSQDFYLNIFETMNRLKQHYDKITRITRESSLKNIWGESFPITATKLYAESDMHIMDRLLDPEYIDVRRQQAQAEQSEQQFDVAVVSAKPAVEGQNVEGNSLQINATNIRGSPANEREARKWVKNMHQAMRSGENREVLQRCRGLVRLYETRVRKHEEALTFELDEEALIWLTERGYNFTLRQSPENERILYNSFGDIKSLPNHQQRIAEIQSGIYDIYRIYMTLIERLRSSEYLFTSEDGNFDYTMTNGFGQDPVFGPMQNYFEAYIETEETVPTITNLKKKDVETTLRSMMYTDSFGGEVGDLILESGLVGRNYPVVESRLSPAVADNYQAWRETLRTAQGLESDLALITIDNRIIEGIITERNGAYTVQLTNNSAEYFINFEDLQRFVRGVTIVPSEFVVLASEFTTLVNRIRNSFEGQSGFDLRDLRNYGYTSEQVGFALHYLTTRENYVFSHGSTEIQFEIINGEPNTRPPLARLRSGNTEERFRLETREQFESRTGNSVSNNGMGGLDLAA